MLQYLYMCLHSNAIKKNPTPSGFNYTNNSMNAQGPSAHLLPLLFLLLLLQLSITSAQLRVDHYRNTCPNVESIVQAAVKQKFEQTFVTAPGTLRLFFHDCFIRGCDASVILAFRNNSAEKNNPDDMSLAGDGFDTVIKAKAAVDRVNGCRNKVSCADILAMATRDVIALSGGPFYAVELGRLDGRTSTKTSVRKHLPHPDFKVDQLKAMFAKHGLTLTDLVALSGAHTIGFSHCDRFSHRIHNFKSKNRVDPTMNLDYAMSLRKQCPKNVDPRTAITLDPSTPQRFDNMYYKNLEQGRGLLTSDQCLFTDTRTRHIVNYFAANNTAFRHAFVAAITKLGRVGVKTGNQGEIRRDCTAVNY